MKLINSKFLINADTFEPELELTIGLSLSVLHDMSILMSASEIEVVLGKSLLNLIKNRDRNEKVDD